MRDAQAAKQQAVKTGDRWFAFSLATNLAQMYPRDSHNIEKPRPRRPKEKYRRKRPQ